MKQMNGGHMIQSRKCAICGKTTGAITGFRTALKGFGYKPEDGYAHEKCLRAIQKKEQAQRKQHQ